MTATPTNLDQTLDGAVTKVLTQVKNPFFKNIAKVIQIKELVSNGFWSDIQYFNVYDESGNDILKLKKSKRRFYAPSFLLTYFLFF